LDKIAELDQGLHSPVFTRKIDTEKIGAFGFSFGGSIAILTALYDDRVKAGVNIDGTFWRHPDGIPKINKPLMTVLNMNDQKIIRNGYEFIPEERNIALFEKSTSAAYYLKMHNAAHANATDLAFLSPILKIVKKTGKIDTKQYHRILNEYLISFFNKYLYSISSGLLDGQQNKYKEAELRARNVEIQF
jgi:dienelactone hydrolase